MFFGAFWRVYLQNHDTGICSITCYGITTLRLPEEVCLHTNKTHKYTLCWVLALLQSHAIYTLGPAGLLFLCEFRKREREMRRRRRRRRRLKEAQCFLRCISSHWSSSLYWPISRYYRHKDSSGMSNMKTLEFVDWLSQMVVLLKIQFHTPPACTFNYRLCHGLWYVHN